jgi:hypothetical protein
MQAEKTEQYRRLAEISGEFIESYYDCKSFNPDFIPKYKIIYNILKNDFKGDADLSYYGQLLPKYWELISLPVTVIMVISYFIFCTINDLYLKIEFGIKIYRHDAVYFFTGILWAIIYICWLKRHNEHISNKMTATMQKINEIARRKVAEM